MTRKAVVLALSALGTAAAAQADDGWRFLPVTDDDYAAEPTLSLIGGIQEPDSSLGDAAAAYGLELAMNCILLQPPSHRIRTMVSLVTYDDSGLTLNQIELSPHYVFEITPNFWLGGGPGVGFVSADSDTNDADMFAFQLGTSAHYRLGNLFLGGEARYQWTQSEDVGPDSGAENWRAMIKLGYAFGR